MHLPRHSTDALTAVPGWLSLTTTGRLVQDEAAGPIFQAFSSHYTRPPHPHGAQITNDRDPS
jgi:hypothetical protein